MPTNWDELLNQYDISFNPNKPYPPAGQRVETDFFAAPQSSRRMEQVVPEYDYNPMNRYKQYLSTEPNREDYRPGKFRNVINSLSSGMEAMESGSLGRAAQLYDMLNDRGYNQAYQGWQGRANKYKADVELENTRYRNATTDYDRRQDNERQSRQVDIQAGNADTAAKRLALEEQKHADAGYQLVDGPNGKKLGVRIRGGQTEQLPTDIPNSNLTAEQRIAQFETTQEGLNRRHTTPSGSAVLGARTATRNTDERLKFSREEGQADREFNRWRHTTPSASMSKPKEVVATPTNTRTPVGLIENGYPEFNNPNLLSMTGNEINYQTDPKKVDAELKAISAKTGKPLSELEDQWIQMVTRLRAFPKRPVSR